MSKGSKATQKNGLSREVIEQMATAPETPYVNVRKRLGRIVRTDEYMGPAPSSPNSEVLPSAEVPPNPSADTKEFLDNEIAIFDFEESEDSIFKHLPDPWQDAIRAMTNEYWSLSYPELLRKVNPTPLEMQIRRRIWAAYDNYKKTGEPVVFARIAEGVCSKQYFYEMSTRPWKLRYLIEPIKDYNEAISELLDVGLARLHEIIMMPLTNWRGAFDPSLVEKLIKVVITVDHRKHGSYMQRSENKHQLTSASVNVNIDQPTSMEEIDARLAELQHALPAPRTVEVTAEPMTTILNSMAGTSADSKRDHETLEIAPRERGEPMDVWARRALKAKKDA